MTTLRSGARGRSSTSRRHSIPLFLAIFAGGCAASAVDEEDGIDPLENIQDDGGAQDADEPAPAGNTGKDAGKSTTPSPADAGKAIADAGPAPADAGAAKADAGVDTVVDASTPKDASAPNDAAVVAVRDASQPAQPPPDAATPTNPNAGNTCKKDTDCTQSCLPVGVAACCTVAGQCGCTWTPGIYCL